MIHNTEYAESSSEVTEPNRGWATDITYVWTLEGWLYIAVVIDLPDYVQLSAIVE